MSELNEFIPLIQSSEFENDSDNEIKDDLVSDLQEANDILAYFKKEYGNSEPTRYEKILKEHEELRVTTIEAVKSENKITVSELDSIKKEFEDIKDIEGYGEWLNRQRLETAKSLTNNAFDFFRNGNYDHTKILSQIQSSDISNLKKNKVNAILSDAYKILLMSSNTKNYDEIKSQYIVIEGIISTALNYNNDLNLHDINGVQDAYSALLTINKLYHVEKNFEEKSGKNFNKYTQEISEQRQERNEIRLRSIDISDEGNYSEEDARMLLSILNKNYSEYSEGITEGTDEDTLLELNGKNKEDVKSFQKRLLQKIIGSDQGFGNGYIVTYNDITGYTLANEEIVTEHLFYKSYKLESETTVNYLNYLYKKNGNDKDNFISNLIQSFGKNKTKDLIAIWSEGNESSSLFDDALVTAFEIINYMTDEEEIKEDFQNNINNITDPIIKKYILEEINNLECNKANDWTTLLHSYAMNSEFSMTTSKEEDSIDQLKRTAHNTAQDSMISKILGGQENFNNEFVKGYKSDLGNYLIKIDDFNKLLQNSNVEEWNSLAFANYIRSFQGNLSSADLVKLIGYENVLQLSKLWNKDGEKQSGNIAKNILEKNNPGIVDDVKLVQETFTSVENIISSDLTINQKEIAQSYLENNTEAQSKFKSMLIEQFQGKVDYPEVLSNKIIERILTSHPDDIFKIFSEVEQAHSVNLLNKENYIITSKAVEENLNNKLLKNKTDNDTENQRKNVSLLKAMKKSSAFVNISSEEEIRAVVRRINNDNISFEEILNEKRQNNYELDQQLTLIENKYNHLDELLTQQTQVEINEDTEEKESNNNKVEGSINYQNYTLDKDTNNPSIETQDGQKIPIDKEEAEMVEKNPDAIENIVKMYEFFKNLNLLSIWALRQDIAISIGKTNINLNDDGLKKSELISFGNAIIAKLNSINGTNLNENNNTIASLHETFQKYSNISSMLSDSQTYGIEGEDKFKYNLRQAHIFTAGYGLNISNFRNAEKIETKKEA